MTKVKSFKEKHENSIKRLKNKVEMEVDHFVRLTGCQDAVIVIHVYTVYGEEGDEITISEASIIVNNPK